MSISWNYHPEVIEAVALMLREAAVFNDKEPQIREIAAAINEKFPELGGITEDQAQKVRVKARVLLSQQNNAEPQSVAGMGAALTGKVGLPGDYQPTRITRVETDETGTTTATFVRQPAIVPVTPVPINYWSVADTRTRREDNVRERVVILNDPQWPYEDKRTWRLVLAFLAWFRPDQLLLAGDIVDFARISRFDTDPRIPDAQAELAYAYARLVEIRSAIGQGARCRWIVGNHEVRWQRHLWRQAPHLVGLRRAGGGEEVLTVPYLLNLDDLGIEWVGAQPGDLGDDYVNSHVVLAEDGPDPLFVAHGWVARKGAGVSALATSEQIDCSVAVGHTHRQAITHRTRQGAIGKPRVLTAIETGTLSRLSLGYSGHKGIEDWQPGFCVVSIFDDGTWTPELVRIDPRSGVLTYGTQRFLDVEPAEEAA